MSPRSPSVVLFRLLFACVAAALEGQRGVSQTNLNAASSVIDADGSAVLAEGFGRRASQTSAGSVEQNARARAGRAWFRKDAGARAEREVLRQPPPAATNQFTRITTTEAEGHTVEHVGNLGSANHGWRFEGGAYRHAERSRGGQVQFYGKLNADCHGRKAPDGTMTKVLTVQAGVLHKLFFHSSFSADRTPRRGVTAQGFVAVDGLKRHFVTAVQCCPARGDLEARAWDAIQLDFVPVGDEVTVTFGEDFQDQCINIKDVLLMRSAAAEEQDDKDDADDLWRREGSLLSNFQRTGCPNNQVGVIPAPLLDAMRKARSEALRLTFAICERNRLGVATEVEQLACCGDTGACAPQACSAQTTLDDQGSGESQWMRWLGLQGAAATQSSTCCDKEKWYPASLAVDGMTAAPKEVDEVVPAEALNASLQEEEAEQLTLIMRNRQPSSCALTNEGDPLSWWQLELPYLVQIAAVRITSGQYLHLNPFSIYIDNALCASDVFIGSNETKYLPCIGSGNTLRIVLQAPRQRLSLCEVQVQVRGSVQPPDDSGCPLDIGEFAWTGTGDMSTGLLRGPGAYFQSKQDFRRPVSVYLEMRTLTPSHHAERNCVSLSVFSRSNARNSGYALEWGDHVNAVMHEPADASLPSGVWSSGGVVDSQCSDGNSVLRRFLHIPDAGSYVMLYTQLLADKPTNFVGDCTLFMKLNDDRSFAKMMPIPEVPNLDSTQPRTLYASWGGFLPGGRSEVSAFYKCYKASRNGKAQALKNERPQSHYGRQLNISSCKPEHSFIHAMLLNGGVLPASRAETSETSQTSTKDKEARLPPMVETIEIPLTEANTSAYRTATTENEDEYEFRVPLRVDRAQHNVFVSVALQFAGKLPSGVDPASGFRIQIFTRRQQRQRVQEDDELEEDEQDETVLVAERSTEMEQHAERGGKGTGSMLSTLYWSGSIGPGRFFLKVGLPHSKDWWQGLKSSMEFGLDNGEKVNTTHFQLLNRLVVTVVRSAEKSSAYTMTLVAPHIDEGASAGKTLYQKDIYLKAPSFLMVGCTVGSWSGGRRAIALKINRKTVQEFTASSSDKKINMAMPLLWLGRLPKGKHNFELVMTFGTDIDFPRPPVMDILVFPGKAEYFEAPGLRMHPFNQQEPMDRPMDNRWHSLRLDADATGTVRFFKDSQQIRAEVHNTFNSGPIRVATDCQGLLIRNVHVSAENRCAMPTRPCSIPMLLPLSAGSGLWKEARDEFSRNRLPMDAAAVSKMDFARWQRRRPSGAQSVTAWHKLSIEADGLGRVRYAVNDETIFHMARNESVEAPYGSVAIRAPCGPVEVRNAVGISAGQCFPSAQRDGGGVAAGEKIREAWLS
eukprot:TRINITY_DN23029_c0_g4_i3.p1 TRINITY_DN23029_c0_g4~~TRINITY_DN23029_c0_g4_i3.p1  ORF type:complete len:1348 (-),score=240.72 TRINITY_DN23029_c0_g4_i3:78-4121(-)